MKPAADMTIEERELTLRWIEGWKQAGPVLEELRAAEIREANTVRSMEMLDGLFDHAAKSTPPRESWPGTSKWKCCIQMTIQALAFSMPGPGGRCGRNGILGAQGNRTRKTSISRARMCLTSS